MSKSALERAFLTNWRRYSGLPDPLREYRFARVAVGDAPYPPARPGFRKRLKAAGLRDWQFDFAWPDAALPVAVEIDGGKHMARWSKKLNRCVVIGRHNQDDDLHKLNAAAALGWRVLHFTGAMMEADPLGCVETVLKALDYLPEEVE